MREAKWVITRKIKGITKLAQINHFSLNIDNNNLTELIKKTNKIKFRLDEFCELQQEIIIIIQKMKKNKIEATIDIQKVKPTTKKNGNSNIN